MSEWDTFNAAVIKIKEDIVNETKRAIKKQVPKTETVRNEIRDNIIALFNKYSTSIFKVWQNLSDNQRAEYKKIFTYSRDRVLRAFQALNVNYIVPRTLGELITSEKTDTDFETDDEVMASTVVDFFNLASKLVPSEFGGESEKLQSFLDALTLLQANEGEFATQAAAFVKTKLTGKARSVVESCTTVHQIIDALKSSIRTDDSGVLVAKILNTKQRGKSTDAYATEIENLATKLQQAYIKEGVPTNTAAKYSTETIVKTLSQNVSSDRVKIIIEAGSFQSPQEAIAKFVSVDSGNNNSQSSILRINSTFRNRRGQHYNYQHQNRRGQSRYFTGQNQLYNNNTNNYNNNYHPRNTRGLSRGNSYTRQNDRGRGRGHHFNGNFSNPQYVRTIQEASESPENFSGPPQQSWGEYNVLGH